MMKKKKKKDRGERQIDYKYFDCRLLEALIQDPRSKSDLQHIFTTNI